MAKRKVPFDNFAAPVQGFNIEGEPASKSWFGFTATLVFFVVVSIVFISGAVSMFQRKNLTVSISEQGLPTPPPTNIKDLIMAFAISDRYRSMTPLTYGVDFLISAALRTWTIDGVPKQLNISEEPLQLEQCNREYFGSLADEFDKVANIEATFCISKNQSEELWTIEGQLGSPAFKFIAIDFYCVPNGTSPCQDGFLSSNVIMYYASSYLDSSNYESPVKQIASGVYDHADAQSYHEKQMIVTARDIITDTGLIFEDKTIQTDLMISAGPSVIEAVNPIPPAIFEFVIGLDSKKITVNRSYKKILDVLATTTGIASTIGLIFGILIQPYVKIKAHNEIVKAVAPDRYIKIELKDFLKALIGNKEAKENVKKVKENKEWVVKNFDVIQRMKNWNDSENVKPKSSNEDQFSIKIFEEKNLLELKEIRAPEFPDSRI